MRRTKKDEMRDRGKTAQKNTLADIAVGEECRIEALELAPEHSLRLKNLGCAPGVRAVCVGESPLGDPRAYCFLGGVVAIRCRDARQVRVGELRRRKSISK